jgi:hypothetical protein
MRIEICGAARVGAVLWGRPSRALAGVGGRHHRSLRSAGMDQQAGDSASEVRAVGRLVDEEVDHLEQDPRDLMRRRR